VHFLKPFILIFLIVPVSAGVLAQSVHTRKIDWKYTQTAKVTHQPGKNPLWFDGAISLDSTGLPYFCERFPLPGGIHQVSAEILNAEFQATTGAERTYLSGLSFSDPAFDVRAEIVVERKQAFALVYFKPYIRNAANGNYEKLVSFSVKINPGAGQVPPKQKSWSFASNSVLASGEWYKIGVTASGIHKITHSELISLGVPADAIDPRQIRIYGNGGAMLPEDNAVFRHDDLQELAIFVSGENDGVFDPHDYILFYGESTLQWSYDHIGKRFVHTYNKYANTSFYFLSTGTGQGKRITNQASLGQSPDFVATTFDHYLVHELDSLNLIKSGREFYGEVFDLRTSYDWTFQLPGIVPGSPVRYKTSVLARGVLTATSFDHYINGSKILTTQVAGVPSQYTAMYANMATDTAYIASTSPLTVRINYNKGNAATAKGWLNYFSLNVTRDLSLTTGHMAFRSAASVGKGVTEFVLGNASSAYVWDVTNPLDVKNITGTITGNNFLFRLQTDTLKEFVAHNGSTYLNILTLGRIANQNLHSLGQNDMVIVTHPEFEGQANRLADMHRSQDGLSVVVVKPEHIYNEFSSGKQDPTAIRAFMKMFYDRAGGNTSLMPRYLLLFGDGSYDNLNRIQGNTNFIVTYQTPNSLAPTVSYVTDDYFGFLDDHEAGSYGGNLDIGIGRLPAKTVEEAQSMVDKIMRYASPTEQGNASSMCGGFNASISNFGDWRNVLCFVADDSDIAGENFLNESETITRKIDTIAPMYNIEKIYMDAYVQVSTPGGQRYPDVNDAISKRVEKGALIINYIGHGGETGWAHEQVLDVPTINGWENRFNLPLFVTATCEFSRFDDPERTSAGEYVLLNPNGGGIALFTTTRLAFSGSNFQLNSRFYDHVFDHTGGGLQAMGDVVRAAKNAYGCAAVIANFCLLGDPALKLAYPKHRIVTTHVNNHPVALVTDTVRAYSKVTVAGEIQDVSGNKLSDYSGLLFPTVFDKKMKVTSRGNDSGYPQDFLAQKNIIYKGKASITDGHFSFSFIVPKDIAYHYGKGKISYYGKNGTTDASGMFDNFLIGGTETNAITDKTGPDIDLYLNDERFVSGGITDKNPFLLAKVADSSGINTVGSGIGHDIAAVLNGNTEKTYVLNDYYESDLDTYQSGMIRYPFKDLASGQHTLSLKVWDVFNNSSERSIDFVVAESASLALNHVLNYPNPFTTYTEFWFEHNKPCCGLDVQVQIFTITGKLIKTLSTYVQTHGFRADPIPWNGLDEYGDPIGRGVYLYRLRVKDDEGGYAEKLEKLVILR
jgi:hypothetical protein